MPADAIDPTWINNVLMDGEELRRSQAFQVAGYTTPGISRTGVLNPRDLAVTLNGADVMVGPGGAVIGSGKGSYITGLSAATKADTLTPADTTNPRRDRVVLEVLDPDNGNNVGGARKARVRVLPGAPDALAASGGGYPPEPVLAITLGWVDVPKSGGGNPVVTSRPPVTAAAGAPIPVWSQAEADALPKWLGLQTIRLDARGWLQTWDGARWQAGAFAEACGEVSVGAVLKGTTVVRDVTLPVGRFTRTPLIKLTPSSGRLTPAYTIDPMYTNATKIRIGADNQTDGNAAVGTMLAWHAIQMTPESSAG